MLIAAALSDGGGIIQNALVSEDTAFTLAALRQWGAEVEKTPDGLRLNGRSGRLAPAPEPIYLGNSGTSLRLLTAVAALAPGRSVLTGTERLQARPVQDLLDALVQAGAGVRSLAANGCPPVLTEGGGLSGGRVAVNCSASSQFLSALLLIGPYARRGLEIEVTHGPVSRPYVDVTLDTMARFGVAAERRGYEWFRVAGGQSYRPGIYRVEPDASQAGYFWAAAAVAGGTVKVRGIDRDSRQGDIRLLEIFERMGCRIAVEPDGLAVTGGELAAVEADMADIPDAVPTLAVAAAYAAGRSTIRNVAHLRAKESDRLASVTGELAKMGIRAGNDENSLWVEGGTPRGAVIATHDDHRIAMSFAVAGLRTPGVVIAGDACVQKSFPTFWEVFEELYLKSEGGRRKAE
jgi:3-phosphoshikimate 1-carboxyvinyltransferase